MPKYIEVVKLTQVVPHLREFNFFVVLENLMEKYIHNRTNKSAKDF